jgi:glyoxylase-like metal-dependent hydrolase (beta-lactamase superfamily II)
MLHTSRPRRRETLAEASNGIDAPGSGNKLTHIDLRDIMIARLLLGPLLCLFAIAPSLADTFRLDEVELGNGVFALIGPTTDRTYENHGLNANFGIIDTPEGAILIDSGASARGAEILDAHVRALTGKAVRWVINSGAQDHRWLGNATLVGGAAEVIAHARTIATQREDVHNQIERLRPALRERLDGTEPLYASTVLTKDRETLELGGRRIQIHYFADAHFPGDVVIWLPEERIAFAGDHVYVDRILGIRPSSNAVTWLEAFERIKALEPKIIVPGHGRVTDIAGAQADTGDYLTFIVAGVTRLAEDMAGVEAALNELGDAPTFRHLANFDDLHRANIGQAYLRAEAGL